MSRKTIAFIGETSLDKYQGQMFEGAMKAAKDNGVNLIRLVLESIFTENRLDNQIEIVLGMVKKLSPDGIMFLGWNADIAQQERKFIEFLNQEFDIPLLSVGRKIGDIPSIGMDGDRNIREILDHLINVHHFRNIAFIQPFTPDERYAAYEDVMKKNNLFREELVVRDAELKDDVDWLFRKRVKRIADILFIQKKVSVDAIISLYTDEAEYLMEELASRGIRIPEDVALTSWEDGERGRYATPSITSVYYPFYEQACAGINMMCGLIKGEPAEPFRLIPGTLHIRRSCGCLSPNIINESSDRKNIGHGQEDADRTIEFNARQIGNHLKILRVDELLPHFIAYITHKSERGFLLYLEKVIIAHNESCDNLYSIQDDLLLFRSAVSAPLEYNSVQYKLTENLWLQCLIIIEKNIEIVIGFNEVLNHGNGHMIQAIGQNIVTTLDSNKLLDILEQSLAKLKVPNCLISLCRNDDGNSIVEDLIYFYHNGSRQDTSRCDKFRWDNILKDLFKSDEYHVFIIYPLHINQELIGYMMFEPGPEDERIYYTLSIQISSALHASQTLKTLKEKNIAIEESNHKLSELDKLKNDFIANITHDFRSPLMVIMNVADLGLMGDEDSDINTAKQRYKMIFTASLKLKDTIDRLLDLAKMDAQGVRVNLRKVNLRDFMLNIADFYKSATLSSSIVIREIFPDHEIENFYTDPDKLEEILQNVISNAFKFIDPLHGEIILSLVDRGDSVVIMIADNGTGISEDKLETIFGRFEQIGNSPNSKHKGTGIGLAFARQLAGYLNGTIHAESDGPGRELGF